MNFKENNFVSPQGIIRHESMFSLTERLYINALFFRRMQPRLSHFPTQWQRFVKASASSTHEGNVQEINQGKMKGEDVMNFYNEIIQADAQTVKQEAKVEVKEENKANDAKSKQFFNISLDEDDDVIRYTSPPPRTPKCVSTGYKYSGAVMVTMLGSENGNFL